MSIRFGITTRLVLVVFVSVLGPLLVLAYYLRVEVSASILREKEDKLFGLVFNAAEMRFSGYYYAYDYESK